MADVSADVIENCACGEMVAWLRAASTGRPYPVEIRHGIQTDKAGGKTATVRKSDFHYCAFYAGLAQFVRAAIERSKAAEIRIRLLTASGDPVVLFWSDGKNVVNVTDGGGFGNSRFYGTVDLETGGFRLRDQNLDGLIETIEAIDKQPIAAARAYGEATGRCCFCNLRLDDERSIIAGYGRRCAEKFALEWGDVGQNSTQRAKRTARAVRRDDD